MTIKRVGFTLLELILALGLTVMIVVLIGYLIQMYVVQSEGSRDRIQQAQVARSILTMIGDDVRGVVRNQPFDASALQQILGGSSGSGAGGSSGGSGVSSGSSSGQPSGGGGSAGGNSAGGSNASPPSGGSSASDSAGPRPSSGMAMSSGMMGSSMSSGSMGSSNMSPSSDSSEPIELPPGIYGTSKSIQIDVSRIPRADQYFAQSPDLLTGTLTDVPSDTKTVSYFVQSPTTSGVRDPLTSTNLNGLSNGGLVRRQLDRSISQYAEAQGNSDQLYRTGELLATEVVALDFSYFDGTTWSSNWDSMEQGLPWLIEITIAMQDPIVAKTNPIAAGIDVAMLDAGTIVEYGIETYSLTVAIPGAQLLSSPQTSQGSSPNGAATDSGMGSVGL